MTNRTGTSAQLAHVRVGDCMHHGILSCASDAPLGEVAGVMAKHRVHCVAITNGVNDRPIGIASDLDLVMAAATGKEPTALQAASTEPLSVSADESLERAAQLMGEHGVAHLVVLDAASGDAVGVLSTLDIAAAYANQF